MPMVTMQQVLKDSMKLASRLKESEKEADNMLAKAQGLEKTVETMKDYHEDLAHLAKVSHSNLPRSSLIFTIQRESKQLRLLESENRELRSALEDHQYALELIMSKYRQQVTQLIKPRKQAGRLSNSSSSGHSDQDTNELVKTQMAKILEMAAVMRRAAEVDEEKSAKDNESLAQLRTENQGLRELLKIAMSTGSIEVPKRSASGLEKEVQTDEVLSNYDSSPGDSLNLTVIEKSPPT